MNYQPVLDFILVTATALLIPVFGAWSTVLVQKIKLNASNIKGKKWENAKLKIASSVFATEQRAKNLPMTGAEKKEFCTNLVTKMLEAEKETIPPEILSGIIDAQVWEMDNPKDQVVLQPLISSPEQTDYGARG